MSTQAPKATPQGIHARDVRAPQATPQRQCLNLRIVPTGSVLVLSTGSTHAHAYRFQ